MRPHRAQPDPDTAFLLEAEALYHRLFFEPEVAKLELFTLFQAQLLAARTDRCEALLRAALDYDSTDPQWRATVLAQAGKMYLARDRHRLAEERLREAKGLVSLDDDDSWLAVSISLALAKCYRLQGDFHAARTELAALAERPDAHPVVAFQKEWFGSLEAASKGHLSAAAEKAQEAGRLLDSLLDPAIAAEQGGAAESFGLGPLPRKRIHLLRLEADLARRRGDYVQASAKIEDAIARYVEDPEDGIIDYAELVRTHVLRQESDPRAPALAEEVHRAFEARSPQDLPGVARSLRCLAQAWMLADPERARPHLEQLDELDPGLYRSGRAIALFGLGELERLQGEEEAARRLYRRSEQSAEGRGCFEQCYGQLGLIELDRVDRPHLVADGIRLLLSRPGVLEHPALEFSIALLGVRTFGREGGHVEAASRAAERFVRCPGRPNWEADTLALTLAAIDTGAELPPLVLNLP